MFVACTRFSRSGRNVTAQIPFIARGIINGSTALEAFASHMRRRLVRKFASLIGLLAILMTTLAPAVSQTLALSARTNAQTNAIIGAHCSAIPGSAIPASQTRVEDHQPSHHAMGGHWDACGYCNFAAHSPAAALSVNALSAHLAATTLAAMAPTQSAAPRAPLFTAQPRAPPSLV